MADIQYICLSDMHLGEEDSLLTGIDRGGNVTPLISSPVMEGLVACLAKLVDGGAKPTLILGGDILELALGTMNQAAMTFETFIRRTMKQGQELFSEIIFLPGNHDHHLWELARETQYVDYITDTLLDQKDLPAPWHFTRMFKDQAHPGVDSYLLSNLLKRVAREPGYEHLAKEKIKTFYPNFGLKNAAGNRAAVFTHGHYTEKLYSLMTTLRRLFFPEEDPPATVNELEAENFAWIDFFWSTLGRSGKAGQSVESIYETFLCAADVKGLLKDLAKRLAACFDIPFIWEGGEAKLVEWVLGWILKDLKGLERKNTDASLSHQADAGLKEYVEKYLKQQIVEENAVVPAEVVLTFGHTHKPFAKDMSGLAGYPDWVDVYNTGGWIIETIAPAKTHGAALVLMDGGLNVTSIRMYQEAEKPEDYKVAVVEASHDGDRSSPFHKQIIDLVKPAEEPWKSFSRTAAAEVELRRKLFKHRHGLE